MYTRPAVGQSVQLWYAAAKRPFAPHHGATGRVAVAARGPGPRNCGVVVNGQLVVVPGGQLRKPPAGG
jgi:hypothetical protein